jgi:uncharacterized protein with NRDE domain
MCLILIAYQPEPRYQLVVAANRDEFFRRPTAPADYWAGAMHVLGGRDLEKGGTWMGVSRDGRWAAVTNYRDGTVVNPGAKSRGELVAGFLRKPAAPGAYANSVRHSAGDYAGFNLIVGDQECLHYYSSKQSATQALGPGLYGLSNGLLDCAWPKVHRGKTALGHALASRGPDDMVDNLLAALADRTIAPDDALPSTGIALDWERRLSAAFISAPGYGTRASTVLVLTKDGEMYFHERSFDNHANVLEDRRFRFERG